MDQIHSLINLKFTSINNKKSSNKELYLLAVYQNFVTDNSRLCYQWGLTDQHNVGDPFLCTAAKIGNLFVVEQLLEAGANLELADANGLPPLAHAIFGHHNHIVKMMCKKMMSKDPNKIIEPSNIIHFAIRVRNIQAMEILLETCPSLVNQKDLENKTPIVVAFQDASPECVSILLKYGADINEVCSNDDALLQFVLNELYSNDETAFRSALMEYENSLPIDGKHLELDKEFWM